MQGLIKSFNISYRKFIQNSAIHNQNQNFHLHGFSISDKKILFNLYGKSLGGISPLRVQKPL